MRALRAMLGYAKKLSCELRQLHVFSKRNLMEKALKEGAESARLYATRFLGLLMRSRAPNVTQWVMRLLVSQVC